MCHTSPVGSGGREVIKKKIKKQDNRGVEHHFFIRQSALTVAFPLSGRFTASFHGHCTVYSL